MPINYQNLLSAHLAPFARLNGADAVAEFLRRIGIKGKRRCGAKCPVAQYLIVCGWADVEVDREAVCVRRRREDISIYVAILPRVVTKFINDFDGVTGGEFYGELVGTMEEA